MADPGCGAALAKRVAAGPGDGRGRGPGHDHLGGDGLAGYRAAARLPARAGWTSSCARSPSVASRNLATSRPGPCPRPAGTVCPSSSWSRSSAPAARSGWPVTRCTIRPRPGSPPRSWTARPSRSPRRQRATRGIPGACWSGRCPAGAHVVVAFSLDDLNSTVSRLEIADAVAGAAGHRAAGRHRLAAGPDQSGAARPGSRAPRRRSPPATCPGASTIRRTVPRWAGWPRRSTRCSAGSRPPTGPGKRAKHAPGTPRTGCAGSSPTPATSCVPR